VRHLGLNLPDVVVILDADCRLGENALRHPAVALFSCHYTLASTLGPGVHQRRSF
jgi:hypothetical protein